MIVLSGLAAPPPTQFFGVSPFISPDPNFTRLRHGPDITLGYDFECTECRNPVLFYEDIRTVTRQDDS